MEYLDTEYFEYSCQKYLRKHYGTFFNLWYIFFWIDYSPLRPSFNLIFTTKFVLRLFHGHMDRPPCPISIFSKKFLLRFFGMAAKHFDLGE